jgi:hypothetical protein
MNIRQPCYVQTLDLFKSQVILFGEWHLPYEDKNRDVTTWLKEAKEKSLVFDLFIEAGKKKTTSMGIERMKKAFPIGKQSIGLEIRPTFGVHLALRRCLGDTHLGGNAHLGSGSIEELRQEILSFLQSVDFFFTEASRIYFLVKQAFRDLKTRLEHLSRSSNEQEISDHSITRSEIYLQHLVNEFEIAHQTYLSIPDRLRSMMKDERIEKRDLLHLNIILSHPRAFDIHAMAALLNKLEDGKTLIFYGGYDHSLAMARDLILLRG